MNKIAVEEHYTSPAYMDYLSLIKESPDKIAARSRMDKLNNLGEERLREMDETGIDMQVLSLTTSGVENLDPEDGTTASKIINDELAEVIKKYPERFAGFATIAPQDPEAAADELERAVTKLGLKGTMINSHIDGEYLDEQKYWVILEMAAKLGVPIYIHPKPPSPDMIKPYLTYHVLTRAMWGFAAEAGLHGMRLICSGVFDKYPDLKIILGHMGESIPYWLWRMDKQWQHEKMREGVKQLEKNPGQYFRDNFYITTSGMFWQPPFQCCHSALGADRILFAVDYPFESSQDAVQFIESVPISDEDKEKICHLNVEKLLNLRI